MEGVCYASILHQVRWLIVWISRPPTWLNLQQDEYRQHRNSTAVWLIVLTTSIAACPYSLITCASGNAYLPHSYIRTDSNCMVCFIIAVQASSIVTHAQAMCVLSSMGCHMCQWLTWACWEGECRLPLWSSPVSSAHQQTADQATPQRPPETNHIIYLFQRHVSYISAKVDSLPCWLQGSWWDGIRWDTNSHWCTMVKFVARQSAPGTKNAEKLKLW